MLRSGSVFRNWSLKAEHWINFGLFGTIINASSATGLDYFIVTRNVEHCLINYLGGGCHGRDGMFWRSSSTINLSDVCVRRSIKAQVWKESWEEWRRVETKHISSFGSRSWPGNQYDTAYKSSWRGIIYEQKNSTGMIQTQSGLHVRKQLSQQRALIEGNFWVFGLITSVQP